MTKKFLFEEKHREKNRYQKYKNEKGKLIGYEKEDGTYKKRFKILSVENTSFKLFDYKYNTDY